MSLRHAVGLLLLAGLGLPAPLSAAERYHSSPACWPSPRYTQHPPTADLVERVSLRTDDGAVQLMEGERSPNGGYRYQLQQVGEDWQLLVDVEGGRSLRLQLRAPQHRPSARWVNEKLVFLRVPWGRQLGSDLIVDVEAGRLLYHEALEDGSLAFEQYRQACAGQCPCPVDAPLDAASAAAAPIEIETATNPDPDEDGLRLTGLVRPGVELGTLRLYASPSHGATRIEGTGLDLRQREVAYEEPALAVYGRRPGWLRLRLGSGVYVWAQATELGEFLPYRVVVRDRLNHLSASWDGRLHEQPGGAARAVQDTAEGAVQLLELRRVDGRLWARVGLFRQSPCKGGDESIAQEGWVPAHDVFGEPLLWFWSRGC